MTEHTEYTMTTLRVRGALAAAVLSLPLAAFAEGASPWLPIPGELSLTLNQTEQSGKSAYIGSTLLPVSTITGGAASKFKRSTTSVRLGYGLSDALALDASIGYGNVKAGAADSDSGLADSTFGLSWRVLDEFEQPSLPTLTLRAGAIVKGNYEGARLAAIGNDQNGFEVAVMLGKEFTSALALWAEVGLQNRSGGVPNATFYEIGARVRFASQWSASVAYGAKKYSGNLDIGGAGFSPARFQDVRAERELVKLGLGFAFAGNQGLSLNYAKVLGGGRNTVKDDPIVGLSYTYAF